MPRVYASCSTGGEKRRKKRKPEVTVQVSGLIDKFVTRISNNETDILLSEDSDDSIDINTCTDASEPATIRPPDKDGSTVRYASIFTKKYGTLVRYAFFVMVRVRYVGTERLLCDGTGTVRWYAI